MGAQNTKTAETVGHFSAEETSHLKSVLNGISTSKDLPVCSSKDLQVHLVKYLDDWLAETLISLTSVKNGKTGEQIISGKDLLQYLSSTFQGTIDEKVTGILQLLRKSWSVDHGTTVSKDEILQYGKSIVRSYLKCSEFTKSYKSWQGSSEVKNEDIEALSEFLLQETLYDGVSAKAILEATPKESDFSLDDLVRGFSKNPLLLNLTSSVLSSTFEFNKSVHVVKLIPHSTHTKKEFSPSVFTSFTVPQIMFINSQIPQELQRQWRFLFSTLSDGESFSKMMGAMLDKGPTVILIKEDSGRVFGAFVDESWIVGPKFHGSEKCFLFHLYPKYAAYPSTGFNTNYQYLNVQQQTFPNGLGIGGKIDYFGIWLDAEFGRGRCSPSCTTFDCPQLSESKEFKLHTVEVWGVGPEPEKEEGVRQGKSILDKDPQAQAILELMNKTPASDGYRDKKKVYEDDYDEDE